MPCRCSKKCLSISLAGLPGQPAAPGPVLPLRAVFTSSTNIDFDPLEPDAPASVFAAGTAPTPLAVPAGAWLLPGQGWALSFFGASNLREDPTDLRFSVVLNNVTASTFAVGAGLHGRGNWTLRIEVVQLGGSTLKVSYSWSTVQLLSDLSLEPHVVGFVDLVPGFDATLANTLDVTAVGVGFEIGYLNVQSSTVTNLC